MRCDDPGAARRHGLTGWRVSPQRLSWMMLLLGAAACLLPVGCGGDDARSARTVPPPDVAVTTLDERDLQTVDALLRLQQTIRLGLTAGRRSDATLPPDAAAVVSQVAERWVSRERDLRALVRLKNAPEPELIGDQYHAWLAQVDAAMGGEWPAAVLDFHARTQRELLRLLRTAGDDASDPDLREFALRNRAGTVVLIERLAQVDDAR